MGCDIHSALQVKDKVSGEWKTIALEILNFDNRDYCLFNFLGNEFRGKDCSKYRVKDNGLPSDLKNFHDDDQCLKIEKIGIIPLNPSTWIDDDNESFWIGDYGFNFLTFNELNEYYKKLDHDNYKEVSDTLSNILSTTRYLVLSLSKLNLWEEKNGNEVRYIYGFDNQEEIMSELTVWSIYLKDAQDALNINNPKYLTMEDYKTGMQEAYEYLRKARSILDNLNITSHNQWTR